MSNSNHNDHLTNQMENQFTMEEKALIIKSLETFQNAVSIFDRTTEDQKKVLAEKANTIINKLGITMPDYEMYAEIDWMMTGIERQTFK
jgi:hypothetical protein